MNWYETSEQKKSLLLGGTFMVCLAMLLVTVRRNNISYDSYWHLQAGLDWIHRGLSPWTDHFSFTFDGAAIAIPPYLFEAALAWLVTNFGLDTGFEIYKLVCFVLALVFMTFLLVRQRAPVLVYCLVLPLLVVLIQFRATVRPELLSYSFCLIGLMLYDNARRRFTARNILPIVVLMLVWSNYHSPVVGYVLFFGLFIDLALQQWRHRAGARDWLKWLAWGLAVVGVGFLNPDLKHPVVHILRFSPEWKVLIQEYQSAVLYLDVAATFALIFVALSTLLMLAWKRQFGLLTVCALLIYYSVGMARMVTPSGIVVLGVFAMTVAGANPGLLLRGVSERMRRILGITTWVLIAMSFGSGVSLARAFMEENQVSAIIFPSDVADYMLEQGYSGRIFNDYQAGGYLIHRLSPHSRVYIDGRTDILYPIEHYRRFMEARDSAEAFNAEVKQYGIEFAILENMQKNWTLMKNSGALGLDYVGGKFSLYVQDNPNLPLFGELLGRPACWRSDMTEQLESEQAKAVWTIPGNSELFPFLELVVSYTRADDKAAYLKALETRGEWTDVNLRFAAHRALDHGLNQMASDMLASISEREFRDYLAAALANLRMEHLGVAEELLDHASRTNWARVDYEDMKILHSLLSQISRQKPLEIFEDDYVHTLAEQLGIQNEPELPSGPATSLFCARN
jgi:hypothetical protein